MDQDHSQSTSRSPLQQAMVHLEAKRVEYGGSRKPQRIPLAAISTHPEVFVTGVRGREIDDYYADQLAKMLATKDDFPPVLLLPVGNGFVLVDGHLRLAAYRANERKDIPAEVFEGTVREAALVAVERNSEQKVALDNSQRQDCAWRFVLASYTIPQIVRATGISRAQVGVMRRAMKHLGDGAMDHVQWRKARRAAEGREILAEMDDDEHRAWLLGKMEALAGIIKRATGAHAYQNPEIMGGAIALVAGRQAPEVAGFIMANLTPETEAELARAKDFEW